MKYRSEQPQFEVWAKEIKQFKQYVMEKANKFYIVPTYKELKIFSMKSKIFDSPSPRELDATTKLKKTISKCTFEALHEQVIEEDGGFRKNVHEDMESQLGDLNTYKKMSFEGREDNNQIPLLLEMKHLPKLPKKSPTGVSKFFP